MNKVSIVILNYNGEKHLKEFLPSIVSNTPEESVQLVVADNASTDKSVSFLKEKFPSVSLIQLDQNYGYAGGYNYALEKIDAEYFVLLNSDVEVTPNWLEPLIEYMDNHKDVAAVMPKIKAYKNKESFEYAGACGGYIDKYGYPFCRGRILYHIEKDEGQHDAIKDIFWASGACFVVRATLFHKAGGFDADFFAHMEEIDLCWRLKSMGFRIVVIPQSVVYHLGGGTLPINTPRKMFLNYRNSLFLLQKNLPDRKLIPILFMRLSLDGTSALVYLFKFSFGFFAAVVKAHFQFYRNLKKSNRKRQSIKKLKTLNNVSQIYPKSMVFSFIIKGKRVFNKFKFE